MKDEELKNWLKSSMIESAPEGFSDRVMEVISLEANKQAIKSKYTLPGKYLLVVMFLLLVISIVLSFVNPGSDITELSKLRQYLDFDWPQIGFKSLFSNNIVAYVTASIALFLFLDYLFSEKRSAYNMSKS